MWKSKVVIAIMIAVIWTVVSVAVPVASEENLQDITGLYQCVGENYEGTVAISKVDEIYHLRWTFGDQTHVGVAIREGNLLASSWSTGRNPGIVVYKIEPGPKLSGKYSDYPGDGRLRREWLTFMKPLEKLPPSRAWEIGERALVNWTGDQYWYPATVEEKRNEGEYFVEFDDGDSEWTDSSRMIAEDIKVGDSIFFSLERRGTYYSGKVTQRQGSTIHVIDHGGTERIIAISAVRVLRPRQE